MKHKCRDSISGFMVAVILLAGSLGFARISGETPNVGVGVWTAVCSGVWFILGTVCIVSAIISGDKQ